MKRTRPPKDLPKNLIYSIKEEPIILPKSLLDVILACSNPADLLGLYCFYYYTAKWQGTNQPKATTAYAAKGLNWGEDKLRRVKGRLRELGLIEDIIAHGEDNRVTGHYIKINFIWKADTTKSISHPRCFQEGGTKATLGVFPGLGKYGGNALSTNNKENALSTNTPTKKRSERLTMKERNKLYLPLVKVLAKIIKQKKNITITSHQLSSWSDEIRKLAENNEVSISRIRKTLQWYQNNIGGEYVPVIESGNSLRMKFMKLEAAMERSKLPPTNNKPTNVSGSRHLGEAPVEGYYGKPDITH